MPLYYSVLKYSPEKALPENHRTISGDKSDYIYLEREI